jgi:predicted amidohydrolase YtcJ
MLIRNATVFGTDATDVRTSGARIAAVGVRLCPLPGEDDVDARGGWLLPGLHDHHIHLRALAAAADSLPLGPAAASTPADFAAALRAADRQRPAGQWIRGIGYHESVAGALDRWTLDRLVPERPVRIQHRTGALWVLNSRACDTVGLGTCPLPGAERDDAGLLTGRLWRMDDWLGSRIAPAAPDWTALSAAAAARGITGFTDATPGLAAREIGELADLVATGRVAQRLHCMARPGTPDPGVEGCTVGPCKIILDDRTLPALDEFADTIRAAHAAGSAVAVHCVTRVQFVLTMTALRQAGERAGDRIEHGAIIPAESMEWLRAQRIPVVTQPHFLAERAAQYAAEVDAVDRPDLWRLRSLRDAGVAVAAGTDAPFGSADPWAAVAGAIRHGLDSTAAESIPAPDAVRLFLGDPRSPGTPRRVEPGGDADLTLLSVPPAALAASLHAGDDLVAATVIAGRPRHLAR